MARQNKIMKSTELQKTVMELSKQGQGYQAISEHLKGLGHNISFMSIKRYMDKVKDKKANIVANDQQLTEYVKARIIDTGEQLREVNKIMWGLVKAAKTSKEFKLKTMKQIMDSIKLADQMMNEFRGLKINQTGETNTVQLVQIVVDKLNELEARGDIKILNPRLRLNNPINQMEEKEHGESGYKQESTEGREPDNNRQPSA